MARPETSGGGAPGPASFLTTRWSVVLTAGRPGEARAQAALADLCAAYYRPIYGYVRRRGNGVEDARDLTQAFFARLLEKNSVVGADPRRGRFRAWLLGTLKHFLANEWDRSQAQKRGAGRVPLSLEFESADERLALEPAHALTPERAFERDWALSVLERAFLALESEWTARGRGELFRALKPLLSGEPGESLRSIGQRLGQSEGAVKVAAHRLRRAFRAALRREIAETVEGDGEVEGELAALIEALGTRAP